jgi:hypothetical protein
MSALLRCFVEKFPLFHGFPALHPGEIRRRAPEALSLRRLIFHTSLAMTKRKPGKFSAAKAVKANARARVGQPKPARVIDTEPRTGRAIKHKPKLDEIIRQEE